MASIDPGQLAALVQAARGSAGTPQPGAVPAPPAAGLDINSLLMKLKSGALPPQLLMQLLALLAGLGGNVPAAAPPGGGGEVNPIEAAMLAGGQ